MQTENWGLQGKKIAKEPCGNQSVQNYEGVNSESQIQLMWVPESQGVPTEANVDMSLT